VTIASQSAVRRVDRPRSEDSQHLLLVRAHRIHPRLLRTMPVLPVHVSIFHPGGRAGMSKHRVTVQ